MCNARKKEKDLKNRKYKISFRKNNVADWQAAYSIIKRSRNFYSEKDVESVLFDNMNKKNCKKLGVNIWTHSDTVEIVKQLEDSGKVEFDNFLWKGKLKISKDIKKRKSS